MKKWVFDADYLQACNCDYGCPCEFAAPPTPGFCHGIGVWKIQRGKYDDLSLDGLARAREFRDRYRPGWLGRNNSRQPLVWVTTPSSPGCPVVGLTELERSRPGRHLPA